MQPNPQRPNSQQPSTPGRRRQAPVAVPGFADGHSHLLKDSAGLGMLVAAPAVRAFHERVARQRSTPMDVLDPVPPGPVSGLAARLYAGLARAAAAGLVEVTEMGVRDWRYLDALAALQAAGPLPARVRVYLASGLAAEATTAELAARRAAHSGPWVRVEGVKFYADGWLGPRTCAMCRGFADTGDEGVLFLDGPALAGRIAPLIEAGWRIATHAIGDRAVAAVLDGYELAWGGDLAAMAAARPRIEHASLLSAELIARMAAGGVTACIQPSFAVTDSAQVRLAIGPELRELAYPWAALTAARVPVVAGSDYPIEVLEPLVGLARLVRGRSDRSGFGSPAGAPPRSRLSAAAAFGAMSDASAGLTWLTADPRAVAPERIDQIIVTGTAPRPF
ncbi:MAG TPA: amidohydrolase family protein [Streptosporangiaceae bacterium]|nr:amidohydrolase family protein [Streptosporangiaceae bacterium]